ncbi:MAG: BspA family leucine-rich repeat surface protein, partial [Clostridia bacterium]|nr:BspA family leucine-rich repeat surface protein [Clostridia bacterium]
MIGYEYNGKKFKGTYDGGSFTISGLNVKQTYGGIGFFGRLGANSTVKNVRLISPTFTATVQSNYYVDMGAIFGSCDNGTIVVENCHVINPTFTVINTGDRYIGAIGGKSYYGNVTVKDCYYYSDDNCNIVGNYKGSISNCARVYQLTLGEGVTAANTDLTVTIGTANYYKQGTEVTLSHEDRTGYLFDSYSVNGSAIEGNTYTMETEDITVSATFAPNPAHFSQSGDIYTIHDETGWEIFCDLIEDGETFSGKTVVLSDDISVTRMAGSRTNSFKGTFYGQENTINANISGNTGGEAVFSGIEGATIKDLTLSGSITGGQHCGALVGFASGTNIIENVNVTADVSLADSIAANKAHHGGVIGHALSSNTTLRGVVYSGTISSTDASNNVYVGGLVGWCDSANLTIENSLFAGTYNGGTLFHPVACKHYNSSNTLNYTNVYYTVQPTSTSNYTLPGTSKLARTITAGQDVTVALSGTATEYTVSGITAYENNSGLKYGDVIYAGNEDNVTLTLGNNTPDGYTFNGYTVSAGALAAAENAYTLTMPNKDVTVNAVFANADQCLFDEKTKTLILRGNVDKEDVQKYKSTAVKVVVADTGAVLPIDSSQLFANFTAVTNIDLTGAQAGNVTNMNRMFYKCSALEDITFGSDFDTSSVTDMSRMFYLCQALTTIDLNHLNTSSVTDMSYMFYNCTAFTTLDLSGWNTSSVTTMMCMFRNCSNLGSHNLTGLDTSSVTTMAYMFYGCTNLTSPNLTGLDTSSVTTMAYMFYGCTNLTSPNLTGLDTSSVTT